MVNKFNLRQLEEHLRGKLKVGETDFFKSKKIAAEINQTPKTIGAFLCIMVTESEDFKAEKWSFSKATTWRVTRLK